MYEARTRGQRAQLRARGQLIAMQSRGPARRSSRRRADGRREACGVRECRPAHDRLRRNFASAPNPIAARAVSSAAFASRPKVSTLRYRVSARSEEFASELFGTSVRAFLVWAYTSVTVSRWTHLSSALARWHGHNNACILPALGRPPSRGTSGREEADEQGSHTSENGVDDAPATVAGYDVKRDRAEHVSAASTRGGTSTRSAWWRRSRAAHAGRGTRVWPKAPVALIALGLCVLALPARFEGRVLLPISAGHAITELDAIGVLPLVVGAVWIQVGTWRRRARLQRRARERPLFSAAMSFVGGVGLGLLIASSFSTFFWWWAVGAAIFGVVHTAVVVVATGPTGDDTFASTTPDTTTDA